MAPLGFKSLVLQRLIMVSSGSGISTENMFLELPEVTFCVTFVLKGQLIEPRYKIEHYVSHKSQLPT